MDADNTFWSFRFLASPEKVFWILIDKHEKLFWILIDKYEKVFLILDKYEKLFWSQIREGVFAEIREGVLDSRQIRGVLDSQQIRGSK